MRISAFIDPDEFKTQIDDWIATFRATVPAPGTDGPLIPGDPEREAEKIRGQSGIPLLQPVVDDLRHISQETGIPFD
jgi:LDH2 family malate/lactate/ureidoglycolate dehydrogenase